MSCSISTSSGSTASGSIVTSRSSRSPVTFTVTMPPPALTSTTSFFSCSWAFIISACICWTCFIIWFMFGCLGMRARLLVEDFFGPELVLQPLEQLGFRQHDGRLRRQLADVVADVERRARERADRSTYQLIVGLHLLLREAGVGLEADDEARTVDRGGPRLSQERADHLVLLADLVDDRRPQRLQPFEVDLGGGFGLRFRRDGGCRCRRGHRARGARRRLLDRGGRGLLDRAAARRLGQPPLELLDPEQERLDREVGLRLDRLQQRELELDARLGAVLH